MGTSLTGSVPSSRPSVGDRCAGCGEREPIIEDLLPSIGERGSEELHDNTNDDDNDNYKINNKYDSDNDNNYNHDNIYNNFGIIIIKGYNMSAI